MANYLFRDPDVIFIHIPKNSGTSLRQALGERHVEQAFGTFPRHWPDAPKLAVIRAPKARFLSAVRMFRFGVANPDDFYHTPRLPGLTVKRALDILEDPQIPFDRSVRSPEGNFKHHIWPQTDPFNGLAQATHILRFETLDEDFARVAGALGLSATLPHARKGLSAEDAVAMTEEDQARFAGLFAADLSLLGYDPEDRPTGPMQPLPAAPPAVYDLWPALFTSAEVLKDRAAEALPLPAADLSVLAATPIPGDPARTWPGRKPDLVAHFKALLPEFQGTSFLCFSLAAAIVALRRTAPGPQQTAALARFYRSLDHAPEVLLGQLNLRWLTSLADTLADHGRTGDERAYGIAGALLANTVKLAESERRMLGPKLPWPPRRLYAGGAPLFDGVIAFGLEKGDLIRNMTARVETLSETDGVGALLLREILARVEREDTVYARLNSLSGTPKPPVMARWRRRLITRLIRWLT